MHDFETQKQHVFSFVFHKRLLTHAWLKTFAKMSETATASTISYAKVAKKGSNEIEDATVDVPSSNPAPKSDETAPQSAPHKSGKKRHPRRDRREKKHKTEEQPAAQPESSNSSEKDDKSAKSDEPVKYVDAPLPKTNPWIKNLPPAPSSPDQVRIKRPAASIYPLKESLFSVRIVLAHPATVLR